MNEEIHHEHTPGVEFEHEDLGARAVFEFLIGVAVMVAVASLLVWGIYRHMDAYQRAHQPVQNPLVQTTSDTRDVTPAEIEKFPQPRLERSERLEINDFRSQEERTLNSYGWVDEKARVVHIPIERAMQLTAERGLPVAPKAGTAPPSPVNVARKAAVRSDTSGQSPPPGKNDGKKERK
jgi:hypothetical protein